MLPRKLQEVPGIAQGGIGWQVIVPARAAKMGSIAVDKAIAKLGTPKEFYQQLEPDQIAEHIDQLLDPKIMVINHFQKNPPLVVRIFRDFGQRELNLLRGPSTAAGARHWARDLHAGPAADGLVARASTTPSYRTRRTRRSQSEEDSRQDPDRSLAKRAVVYFWASR
ncbi:MAG: hypothetical protein ABIR34_04500 [Marmoricola sp.]